MCFSWWGLPFNTISKKQFTSLDKELEGLQQSVSREHFSEETIPFTENIRNMIQGDACGVDSIYSIAHLMDENTLKEATFIKVLGYSTHITWVEITMLMPTTMPNVPTIGNLSYVVIDVKPIILDEVQFEYDLALL